MVKVAGFYSLLSVVITAIPIVLSNGVLSASFYGRICLGLMSITSIGYEIHQAGSIRAFIRELKDDPLLAFFFLLDIVDIFDAGKAAVNLKRVMNDAREKAINNRHMLDSLEGSTSKRNSSLTSDSTKGADDPRAKSGVIETQVASRSVTPTNPSIPSPINPSSRGIDSKPSNLAFRQAWDILLQRSINNPHASHVVNKPKPANNPTGHSDVSHIPDKPIAPPHKEESGGGKRFAVKPPSLNVDGNPRSSSASGGSQTPPEISASAKGLGFTDSSQSSSKAVRNYRRNLEKKYPKQYMDNYVSDSELYARRLYEEGINPKEIHSGDPKTKEALGMPKQKTKGQDIKSVDMVVIRQDNSIVPVEVKNQKVIPVSEAEQKFKTVIKYARPEVKSRITHFEIIANRGSIVPGDYKVKPDGSLLHLENNGVSPPLWGPVSIDGKPVYIYVGDLGKISQ